MQEPDGESAQFAERQARALLDRARRLDLLRVLDQRTDDVGASPEGDLVAHALPATRDLERLGRPVRLDGQSALGHLVQHRAVEVAEDDHGRGSRYRGGGHHQQIRVGRLVRALATLVAQRRALLDAEAMLFVDDDDAQGAKAHVVGQQRVRADHDVDGTGAQSVEHALTILRAQASGEQLDRQGTFAAQDGVVDFRQTLEVLAQRGEVLLGEHLGRRHQRSLSPAVDRRQQRGQRDDRLAGSDVALEESVHRQRRGEVGGDLAEHATLGASSRRSDDRPRIDAPASTSLVGHGVRLRRRGRRRRSGDGCPPRTPPSGVDEGRGGVGAARTRRRPVVVARRLARPTPRAGGFPCRTRCGRRGRVRAAPPRAPGRASARCGAGSRR